MANESGGGIGVLGPLVGSILGMATEPYYNELQLSQNKKLMKQQIHGQKELGRFNRDIALQMWQQTQSAEAQRQSLENAGLNVGLMYKGGGPGGTTAAPAGGVSSATASPHGAGMGAIGAQLGMAMQMQQAQIENIKADTQLKKNSAGKPTAETEQINQTIEKLKQETANSKEQGAILALEKQLKAIELSNANAAMNEILRQIYAATDKAEAEAKSAMTEAKVDQATQDARINQIKTAGVEQNIRIAAAKAGMMQMGVENAKTQMGIAQIANDIVLSQEKNKRENKQINLNELETLIKQRLAEMGYNEPAQIKQWTSIITDVIRAGVKPQE